MAAVRETPDSESPFRLREHHLHCLWYDATHRPARLRTHDGAEVEVVHPGIWNQEAGPDFRNALLSVGRPGAWRRGDVEIHIRPSDWVQHGHGDDPAYDGVIAHVCYFPGEAPDGQLPSGALQIALKPALDEQPRFSLAALDETAYPYDTDSRLQPWDHCLAGWHDTDVVALLEAAGEARLAAKAGRLRRRMATDDANQILYEEVMAALGYKHNTQSFHAVARILRYSELRELANGDAECAYALLMGVAGLLPEKPAARWDDESTAFLRRLWDHWWKRQSQWEDCRLTKASWTLGSLRPQNHPARRLMAAAILFSADQHLGLRLGRIERGSAATWLAAVTRELTTCPDESYWSRRYGFGGRPRPSPVALLGRERAAAILTNVIVPFLAAGERLGPADHDLLQSLPADHRNRRVRDTAHLILGPDHNPKIYRSGLRHQGLLQLHQDFLEAAACPGRQAEILDKIDHWRT